MARKGERVGQGGGRGETTLCQGLGALGLIEKLLPIGVQSYVGAYVHVPSPDLPPLTQIHGVIHMPTKHADILRTLLLQEKRRFFEGNPANSNHDRI